MPAGSVEPPGGGFRDIILKSSGATEKPIYMLKKLKSQIIFFNILRIALVAQLDRAQVS